MSSKDKDTERCESKLEDAENTARIGDFGKAAKKYSDSVDACRSLGWDQEAEQALLLSYLYPCNQDVKDKKDLLETGSLRKFLENASKLPSIKVTAYMPGGLYGEFDTAKLLTEAKGTSYMSLGLQAPNVVDAVKLLERAYDLFLEIGDSPLIFSRYVSCLKRRTTGNNAALECEGHIEFIKGRQYIEIAPPKATEYLIIAAKAYRAARLYDVGKSVRARIQELRATRKCWMCGREIQSADHFKIVKADVGAYFENLLRERNEDMRVINGTSGIALCSPCYTAVFYEADRIARGYHSLAMQAIAALEARVRQLEAAVNRI
ncbi:MAG: hypothetical protein WED07_13145 [Candidatus Freyarchaeum deiterrae]